MKYLGLFYHLNPLNGINYKKHASKARLVGYQVCAALFLYGCYLFSTSSISSSGSLVASLITCKAAALVRLSLFF